MRSMSLHAAALLSLIAPATLLPQAPPQGPLVHTVAPSASTEREARRIMRLCRWTDTTSIRDADLIMVVLRSSGGGPLAPSYANLKWLLDDANAALNDAGAQFHVYFFILGPDDIFQQVSHHSYDATDGRAFAEPFARLRAVSNAGLVCGF
jgi:hypothetical protein